jgi:hypothetical protein
LDAQNPSWADDTTCNDYKPLPGRDYSDPSIQPTVKKWRVALVMTDFPDREYSNHAAGGINDLRQPDEPGA